MNNLYITLGAIVLCLFLGWQANTIWTGYKNEKVLLQQEAVQETIKAGQATIAKQFEDYRQSLVDLAKGNTERVTTIIKNNQPIYQQQCIDQDGLDQLKKYKDASNENGGTK